MTDPLPALSAKTRAKLAALFARLPTRFVSRLADAIALDQARDESGLPQRALLDLLHYELRRADELEGQTRQELESAILSVRDHVRNALPFSRFGGFGPMSAPLDLSVPPDGEKLSKAENGLRRLLGLDAAAAAHGLAPELSAVRGEIAAMLRALKAGLVREIRAERFAAGAEAHRNTVLRLGQGVLAAWELAELEAARAAA